MAEIKPRDRSQNSDFIKFLGTAGARFVMIKQLRSSGGIWISSKGMNLLVDPGPGSIVRCSTSRPKLDPSKLDGIILTHCHLDHSGDINVMIEAMTGGGFKKRGLVFCSKDAIGQDAVILKYVRVLPERIEVLEGNKTYRIGKFAFRTSMRHVHTVETYGLKFKMKDTNVAILADTRYFKGLADSYNKTDLLIMCVAFLKPLAGIDHLSLIDAEALIREIKPKKVILTHFGMTMLKAKPHIQAQKLTKSLGIEVIAAYDGMAVNF
ncbi:MAG: MBL fold metallo-hydrolase [Candidatus Omnitrophota bacterium]